jgi:hypothetical protein
MDPFSTTYKSAYNGARTDIDYTSIISNSPALRAVAASNGVDILPHKCKPMTSGFATNNRGVSDIGHDVQMRKAMMALNDGTGSPRWLETADQSVSVYKGDFVDQSTVPQTRVPGVATQKLNSEFRL